MILFSDAVFAIAITLLVIEIKVPPIDRHIATDELLLEALDELVPRFIGFVLSFFIIGLYWIIHHRMFGYVVNYTHKLLWLNLIFLLAVVLMPFSTAFYSEYITHFLKVPMIVYASNIIFLGIMNYALWHYLCKPGRGLTEGIGSPERRYFTFRAAIVPSVFLLIAIIYLTVSPRYAVWIPAFVPVVIRLYRSYYFKKHKIKI